MERAAAAAAARPAHGLRARGVIVAVASIGLVLALPTVADAHATLVSSEPAAGSTLRSSPRRVRLVFNEPIEASLGHITLLAAGGSPVTLPASGDPHDVHALMAPVDSLGPGGYRIVWRVVSADGHPVSGSLAFTVGTSAPDGATAGAGESATAAPVATDVAVPAAQTPGLGPVIAGAPLLAAGLRGAGVWCLMTLAGLLVFLVWTGLPSSSTVGRLVRWLAIAAPLLLAAHLVVWLADTAPDHRIDALWAQAALATHGGRIELARWALALLALWAAWVARRMTLAMCFALGTLAVSGAIGHAAAIHPAWAIPVKVMHLVAVSAWIGGLVWLVVGGRDASGPSVTDAHRVSTVALAAVIVVLVSGTVETLIFAPSPVALLRSAYGALVATKLVGLGALVAFGAYHRKYSLPRLRRGIGAPAFRRSVAWEFGVMTAVVLLGGWLAYVAPPAGSDTRSLAYHSPTPGLPE